MGTTLKEYRDSYFAASTKASDIARQLGFAGIALIWIFKSMNGSSSEAFTLPEELFYPALLIILALGLDLLQYFIKAGIWGWIQRRIEDKFSDDTSKTYLVAPWVNWPVLACFWVKLGVMIFAYCLLFTFVSKRVEFGPSTKYQTLYSNSVSDSTARVHVSTFDSHAGNDFNKKNCEATRQLFQKQPGLTTKFWCEVGRFRK